MNEHKKTDDGESSEAKEHPHFGPNSCPICGGPIPCLKH